MSEQKPRKSRAKHTLPPVAIPAVAASTQAVTLTGDRLTLWNDIRSKFVLNAADEALLRNATEALERAAEYAQEVTRSGGTFVDRFGAIRANPASMLERDFRGLAARTLAQLAARLGG